MVSIFEDRDRTTTDDVRKILVRLYGTGMCDLSDPSGDFLLPYGYYRTVYKPV